MADTGWTASSTPTIGKLHIDAAPAHCGIDPSVAALMGTQNAGMFGGANSLLPLLIGAFLFGGKGFGIGGYGYGAGYPGVYPGPVAGAGAFAAEAVAAQSIFTPKDTSHQLNNFQSWAQNNASALAAQICGVDKSVCISSREIIEAVNALTPQMYQSFAAQAMQSCQETASINKNVNDGFTTLHDEILAAVNGVDKSLATDYANLQMQAERNAGAAALAECQTQNLVNTTASATQNLVQATTCDIKFTTAQQFTALAQQLAACCCEQRLAVANQNALIEKNTAALQNQIAMQTCELKTQADQNTAAILAKLNQQDIDALRAQLSDAKTALSNSEQTNALLAAIGKRCGDSDDRRRDRDSGGGVTNTINVTDIATAVARALNQSGTGNTITR